MKYLELKEILNKMTDEQLNDEVVVLVPQASSEWDYIWHKCDKIAINNEAQFFDKEEGYIRPENEVGDDMKEKYVPFTRAGQYIIEA